MEVFPAAVGLIIRALIASARWGGRARRLALERATAAADDSREAALEARVMVLEDMVEQRDAHIEVLESRLGEERPRKPYPLMERLRIIWLMQYFEIPGRRLKETLGVSRSSVRRWLKGFEEGRLGKGNEPKEPVNKTPREIAELIWEIFRHNPLWGRHRIAMTLWALGAFVSATTVRDILLCPRPQASSPAPVQAQESAQPRQIVARHPNHVWSIDRTRVMRWGIWPTLCVLGGLGTPVWGPSPVALPGEEQCGGRESEEDGTRMKCRAVRQGRMGLQRRGRTLPVRDRAEGSIGRVDQAASRYAVT